MAKILIADDDPSILESTSALLELYGHDTATVQEVDRIRDRIEEVAPDILLQDARMPGLDVDAFLARLRDETSRELVVVVFTGDDEMRERLVQAGADAGLAKPFDPPELAALIDRLLGERKKGA